MDEERYERERKMYKNFCDQKSVSAVDEQEEIKAVNYRLMSEEEIPSWFVEAVTFR
jgi:hypothetical protein